MAGRVVYLGWDWRYAAPLGSRNDGWLTVLAASLAGAAVSSPLPLLSLERIGQTAGVQLNLQGIPLAPLTLLHSADLTEWSAMETYIMPASGIWRRPTPLGMELPAGFFRALEE